MQYYNFWQDLFDTYQSLPNWLKLAWLIVPPAFIYLMASLFIRYRSSKLSQVLPPENQLVYTVYQDRDNEIHFYRHKDAEDLERALYLENAFDRLITDRK